ncbi:MAG: sigma-54-dependent Fis family transcriptional regulator, partial [Pseudomonadales bacterium]|nr:sigma-54-dependent Fis family transcriptional regulator [Pseudomonadales bacterium]
LLSYDWPGNVRELSHVVERATILCKSGEIGAAELGLVGTDIDTSTQHHLSSDSNGTLDQITRAIIAERLRSLDGNGQKAAQSLGLSKSAFYRHLKKYNL